MFDDLKKNLEQEKKILKDMHSIQVGMASDRGNKAFYLSSLKVLAEQLALLNKVVPDLLREWSPICASGVVDNKKRIIGRGGESVKMSYVSPSTKEKRFITINKKDKREFLKKLKMSEGALSDLKNMKMKGKGVLVRKPSEYARASNKLFGKYSNSLSHKFVDLSGDLKRANIRFLLATYLSMMMMSTFIAFVFGLFVFGFMMFLTFSNLIYIVVPFGLAGLTSVLFYIYPSSEASSVQKKISRELPFVTIHMAAVAGSNIEPVKIFKIIAMSGEYPNVGKEIRKVIVQIEIYGYDLVTSLKNVAMRTSNKKLSELFSGLATNISSGGELKNYLEKKSESFLLDYRLERQKYSDLAGTFMDVYISILVAAPLILMMMFIVMNVAGLGMGGLGINTLLTFAVIGVGIVNVIFLVVLNIKQPEV